MGEQGDGRVSDSGDHVAMMVDMREKGRPPGEPPDKPASWSSKVSGGNVGGMSTPEEVLADEFVKARLCLEFPDGEDGEPVITIGEEVLDAMNGLWKNCMIVKVLGRNVSVAVLSKKLKELWKPTGALYVMDLPRQFFMIRFGSEDEYYAALTGGPWRVFGSHLVVTAWSPEFNPLRDEISTTPVWVRLSNIPVNFYHKSILLGIAKGLGKPIKVDLTTLHFERARFARVCIEVNLRKPLKGSVMINGERYYVAYEGLSSICSRCGMYGHLVHRCPKQVQEEMVEKEVPSGNDLQNVVNGRTREVNTPSAGAGRRMSRGRTDEEGFTVVNSRGRRAATPVNPVTFSAGNSMSADGGDNLMQTQSKDLANITVSNSFGSLGTNMESHEMGQGVMRRERNQEKDNQSNLLNKEARFFNQPGGSIGGRFALKQGGGKENNGPQKNGGRKVSVANGPRPKPIIQNRPVRGLVFGPITNDLELSSNGKRLRVEQSNLGRASGASAKYDPVKSPDGNLVEGGLDLVTSSQHGRERLVTPEDMEAECALSEAERKSSILDEGSK